MGNTEYEVLLVILDTPDQMRSNMKVDLGLMRFQPPWLH